MSGRFVTLPKMCAMRTNWDRWTKNSRQLSLPGLTMASVLALALAFSLTACQNVATYTQPTLVRVIDASYGAPAINVDVNSTLFAANIGQGTITAYGTLTASSGALIKIAAATSNAVLASTNASLLAGKQHSIFLTDTVNTPGAYTVTILQDQQIAAAGGHSAFRFLNHAPTTGAVDVYMIPAGSTLAKTVPIVTALPAGANTDYISFPSQTVTMVITPTGVKTPKYTSAPMALTGGEVRTVLILDAPLTSNPPVAVFIGNDFD
jgi:Domain of unknown function (DUF4397)